MSSASEARNSEEKYSEVDDNEKFEAEEELEIVDEVGDLDEFDVLDEVNDEEKLSLDEISDDDEPGLKRKDDALSVCGEMNQRSMFPVKRLTAEDLASPQAAPILKEICAALTGQIKANKNGITEIQLQGSKEVITKDPFTKAKQDMWKNKVNQFERSGKLPGLAEGSLLFVRKIPIDAGAGLLKSLFPKARNILLPRSDDGLNLGFAILQSDSVEETTPTVEQHTKPTKTQKAGGSLSNISPKSQDIEDTSSMGSSLPDIKLSKTVGKDENACEDRTKLRQGNDADDNSSRQNTSSCGRGFKRGMPMRSGHGFYRCSPVKENQRHQPDSRSYRDRGMKFRGGQGCDLSFRGSEGGKMPYRDNQGQGMSFRGKRGRRIPFRGNRGFQHGMANSRGRGFRGGQSFNHTRNAEEHFHSGRGLKHNYHRQDSPGRRDHHISTGEETGDHCGDEEWSYAEEDILYEDDLHYEDGLHYEDDLQYDNDLQDEDGPGYDDLCHEDGPGYDDLCHEDGLHCDDQTQQDIRYRDRPWSAERYEDDVEIDDMAYTEDDSVRRHHSPHFERDREHLRPYDRGTSNEHEVSYPDDQWHSIAGGKRKRSASPYSNRGRESYHGDSGAIRDDQSDSRRSRRSLGQGSARKIIRTNDGELLVGDSSSEQSERSISSDIRGRPWRPENRAYRKRKGCRDLGHQKHRLRSREEQAGRMPSPRSRSSTPSRWRKPTEDNLSPDRQLHSPSPDRKSGRVTPLQPDAVEDRIALSVGGLEETSDRGGIILTRTLNGDILLSTTETTSVKPILPLAPVDPIIERHLNVVRTVEGSIGLPKADSSPLEDKRGKIRGRSPANYRPSRSPSSHRSGSRHPGSSGARGEDEVYRRRRRREDQPRPPADTYQRSASEFEDHVMNSTRVHHSRSPRTRGHERLTEDQEYDDGRDIFHDDDDDEYVSRKQTLHAKRYQKQNVHYSSRNEEATYDEDVRGYIRSERDRSRSRGNIQPFEHSTQDHSRRVFSSGHQRFTHPVSSNESGGEDYERKPKSQLDTKSHTVPRADAVSYKVRIRNDYYTPNKVQKQVKNKSIEESFEAIDSDEDSESLVEMDGSGVHPERGLPNFRKHQSADRTRGTIPKQQREFSENLKHSQVSPKTNIPLGSKDDTMSGKRLLGTHKSPSPISPIAGGRYFNRSTTPNQMSGKTPDPTCTTSAPKKPHPATSAGVQQTSSGVTTPQSSPHVSCSFQSSQQSVASQNAHPSRVGNPKGSLIQLTAGGSTSQQGSMPTWKARSAQKAKWHPKKPFPKKNPRWMGQNFQSANQQTNPSGDVSDVRKMLINQLQLLEQGVQTDPAAISNIAQQLKKLGHQKKMQSGLTQGLSSLPTSGNANLSSGSGQPWTASHQNPGYGSSSQIAAMNNRPYCDQSTVGVSQSWQRFPPNSGVYGTGVLQYGAVSQAGLAPGPQTHTSNPQGNRPYSSHQYSNSARPETSSTGNVSSTYLGNSQTFSSAPVYQTPLPNSRNIWPS